MSMVERVLGGLVAVGMVVGIVAVTASPASAQSIFSDLFGFTIKPNAPRIEGGDGLSGQFSPRVRGYGGRYRTVCVRMCDGYYFPLSQSTSRSNFHRDGERCQSRCAGDSRLFYMPAGTVDMNRAVDVTGLSYRNIDNAFVYRKKLVKGCMCRHRPWSPEERARHQMYELDRTQTAEVDVANSDSGTVDARTTKTAGARPNWDSVGRLYAEDFGGVSRPSSDVVREGRSVAYGRGLDGVYGLTKPNVVAPRRQPEPVVRPRAASRKFGLGKLWSDEGH